MCTSRPLAATLVVFLLAGLAGEGLVRAQQVEVTAGGGWTFALSDAAYTGTVNGQPGPVETEVDLGAGRHLYATVGYVQEIGTAFDLGVRARAQASRFGGDASDFTSGLGCGLFECTVENTVRGRVRALTLEGRIILTSLGRIEPYLLVGLGAVRTTLNGNEVEVSGTESSATVTFSEVQVTDAGGDVGFGAAVGLGRGLSLDAEMRFTGSLPGGKENAITVLPFSLGLAYTFQ